jgi:nitrite reductase/ring-hydroxylating ferredoxin subunit
VSSQLGRRPRAAGRLFNISTGSGPLQEDTISDGRVTWPWPGSTFRFADGSIVRSPASTPQPCYQMRIQDGRIEVRAFT